MYVVGYKVGKLSYNKYLQLSKNIQFRGRYYLNIYSENMFFCTHKLAHKSTGALLAKFKPLHLLITCDPIQTDKQISQLWLVKREDTEHTGKCNHLQSHDKGTSRIGARMGESGHIV